MKKETLAKGVDLYLGDCREVLSKLRRVGLVITDPPYEKTIHKAKARKRKLRTDGGTALQELGFDGLTEEMRQYVARQSFRLSTGWSITFCTPEGVAPWRDAIEAAGSRYKRACFWHKPDAAPQFNGQGPGYSVEAFTTAWNGDGFSKWNGGGRGNLFTHLCQPSERKSQHPTEKPVTLMAELISLFSQPGEIVLDPFMGIGATGVAAVKFGRRFIGIEIEPKYYAIARQRILAEIQQTDFFVKRPSPMKQGKLL